MTRKDEVIKDAIKKEVLNQSVILIDSQEEILQSMYNDIALARKSVYIEIYRIGNDSMGEKFRDLLAAKAREGVQVKVLVDSWGTPPTLLFFEPLIRYGGEVKYFKKVKFFVDFFTKNHHRNHRKIIVIDENISYIGSSNITGYSLKWREIALRIEGPIGTIFKKLIIESSKLYDKYIFNKFSFKKTVYYDGFEIIQDLPSIYRQQIKKRYEKLIAKAKKEIYIETPYFLPGYKLRKLLARAVKRGVDVHVILPRHSDVKIVDLLRDKYLKYYYKAGVRMHFYTASNLHAKCLLIDKEIYAVGSANFDYRSFRYQHEIVLIGKQPEITNLVHVHMLESLAGSQDFDYQRYLRRPLMEKIFGWLLLPFRHLF